MRERLRQLGTWLLALATAVPLAAQTGAATTPKSIEATGTAVSATNLPTLSEKQEKVLIGLARERYIGRWTDLTTPQLTVLRRRAEAYFETQRRGFLPGGLVASLRFTDTNATRIAAYEALDISAAQTGYLLAAHAYNYAVLRDPRTLASIRTLLSGVEMLLNSSDRPGYVARFAGPADDPAYRAYYANYGGADPARPGFGKLAFPGKATNGTDLVWLGGTSRDEYAGLNFGLAMTRFLVSDPGIRARCATNTAVMLGRLVEDGWRLDDGHGNLTFVTPLLKTALLSAGASADARTWRGAYLTNAAQLVENPAPTIGRYVAYARNVATFANYAILSRLEPKGGTYKLQFQDHMSQMWRDADVHLNPFFAAAYVGAFDKAPNSPIALATLEGGLYSFPAPPRWDIGATNSTEPDLTRLEANGSTWSRYALLVNQQPAAPFQWMQSPFRLDGPGNPLVQHAGVDYVLAFWMARDSGLIKAEEAPPYQAKRHGTNNLSITNILNQPLALPETEPNRRPTAK